MDSDMSKAEVTTLISIISAMMDEVVDTSKHALVLRGICQLWTAYRVMLKDPSSRGIGQYNEDRGTTLRLLKEERDWMMSVGGGGNSFTPASEGLE